MLLERDDVNPDKPDNYGQTPLSIAASDKREGAVKILLGRNDVNPDKLDNKGQTPLWRAAYSGGEGVVKILT
jgi:ankyrin repeat protein